MGFLWLFFAVAALETGTHIASLHIPGYEEYEDEGEVYSAALLGTTAATILCVVGVVQITLRMLQPSDVSEGKEVLSSPEGAPSQQVPGGGLPKRSTGDHSDVGVEA